jgi:hypothetical protein
MMYSVKRNTIEDFVNLPGHRKCEIVEPIKVSETRMILKCAVCGRIVAWSDSDIAPKNKIYPSVSDYSNTIVEQWR